MLLKTFYRDLKRCKLSRFVRFNLSPPPPLNIKPLLYLCLYPFNVCVCVCVFECALYTDTNDYHLINFDAPLNLEHI